MDNILEQARKKVSSLKLSGEVVDEIPNDPIRAEKRIKTEDIYFDDSLKQMLDSENLVFFHNHLLTTEEILKLMLEEMN